MKQQDEPFTDEERAKWPYGEPPKPSQVLASKDMTLDEALIVLAGAHTREDHQIGFTVSETGDTFMLGRGRYYEAWKAVRQYLHMKTEVAPYE